MKKYIYIVMAILLATFASCQSEDVEMSSIYKDDTNAVHFSASIDALQTRVNTMGKGDTWENGDMIKVYNLSTNALVTKDEAVYQYKNNNWELIGNNYIVWADGNETGENTFKAFYPYKEGTDDLYDKVRNLYFFTLPYDQSSNNSTDDNYIGKADFMMATAKVAKSTEPVNLQFSHLLSKVTVNITKYNDQYEDTKPSIKGGFFALPDFEYALDYDGYYIYSEDSKGQILPFMTPKENGLHSFTAILAPSRYGNYENFFELETEDGLKLPVNASGILTTEGLKAGHAYTFGLVVGKNVVSIEKVTVTPWTSNDWDNKEGIADEAYTFKVDADDNSKITLTSLKEGFTSNIDEKTIQELRKHSKLDVHGAVNDQDVKNLINWICFQDYITIDLSNTTLNGLSRNMFPFRRVNVELVIPRCIRYIDDDIFAVSLGSMTLDLTKCNPLPMLNYKISINDVVPSGEQRRIVIKIPSSQKDLVELCGWNATPTNNYVSYTIEYVD